VPIRHNQLIPVNKVVDEKEYLEKAWMMEEFKFSSIYYFALNPEKRTFHGGETQS
jgi:hypothetical protein